MFTNLIVQPIFNLLVIICALIPGNNFGVALIIFAVLMQVVMIPLKKKQLRSSVAMQALQPELKRISEVTKNNPQKRQQLTMELYKERGINPLSALGTLVFQLPLILGMFSVIKRIVADKNNILTFSYNSVLRHPWLQELKLDISKFDNTLFGFIDLSRPALGPKGIYFPALVMVLGSAALQVLTIRQTMPKNNDKASLRKILSEAKEGKQADTADMNAAMSRNLSIIMPIAIVFLTINFAGAFALYWFAGAVATYFIQIWLLKKNEQTAEAIGAKATVVPKKKIESKKKGSK
jgi:YidC/Oxa1 family membrane protein insertase